MDDVEVHRHEAKDAYRTTAGYAAQWDDAAPWMAGLVPWVLLGVAAFLVGGLLHQIWTTGNGESDGLRDTAQWFQWIGRGVVGAALVYAAFRPSPALPAVRIALLGLGAVLLLGLTGHAV